MSLRAVVEVAVEASRPVIDASRHSLRLALPEQPLWLDADPTRLAQVVSNLLTNAAKYTPEGGCIELTAAREGRDAIVRVTDTGLGIPAGMLTEVFEMFTQVNRTLERLRAGLALASPWSSDWSSCTAVRSPPLALDSVRAARSRSGSHSSRPRPGKPGRQPQPRSRRPNHRTRAAACWWSMTTSMGPRAWRKSFKSADTRRGWLIMARTPWTRLARSIPRSCCSTSAFPG